MGHIRRLFGSRGHAAAFTLVEIIVGLAVVLILAAVAVPSLNGYLDQKAVESAASRLTTVSDALTGGSGFLKAIGHNAARLSNLSSVIVQNVDWDSCHNTFTKAGDVNSWNGSGPFVNFVIEPATGLVTSIGNARDTITRIPFSASTGNLRLNFLDGVEERYATLLDSYVDGGNGSTTGAVQWVTPAVNGLVTMYYFIPVNNKC